MVVRWGNVSDACTWALSTRDMEQLPSYPMDPIDDSAADRLVTVATGLPNGQHGADPRSTSPLTWRQAQEVLDEIGAGQAVAPVPGPINVVAEFEPGRLDVRR